MKKVTTGEHVSLRMLCPELPVPLVKAVQRAMSVDRDFRFSTARDFLDALAAIYETVMGGRYVPPWALVAAPAYVETGDSHVRGIRLSPPPMLTRERPDASPITKTLTIGLPGPPVTKD